MRQTIWTLEKIKEGFENFYKENGRYPTALEIDSFSLLPSSRQIQRKYGGLKNLKSALGLPLEAIDFGKGSARSTVARLIGKRGKEFEMMLFDLLVQHFGEMFVHAQKPFNSYKNRFDFYVFSKKLNFGVDIFYGDNLHNIKGCINLKERIYRNLDTKTVLLSANPSISQTEIDNYLLNRTKKLPDNIQVLSLEKFKDFISGLRPLRIASE